MIFLSHLTICKWLIFIKSTRYMPVFICISSIKLAEFNLQMQQNSD